MEPDYLKHAAALIDRLKQGQSTTDSQPIAHENHASGFIFNAPLNGCVFHFHCGPWPQQDQSGESAAR